jgi:hypothetical protein
MVKWCVGSPPNCSLDISVINKLEHGDILILQNDLIFDSTKGPGLLEVSHSSSKQVHWERLFAGTKVFFIAFEALKIIWVGVELPRKDDPNKTYVIGAKIAPCIAINNLCLDNM